MGTLKIGIAGGGVGGLAAAIALRQQGHDVTVFEQARGFSRVGADINLTPKHPKPIPGYKATLPGPPGWQYKIDPGA